VVVVVDGVVVVVVDTVQLQPVQVGQTLEDAIKLQDFGPQTPPSIGFHLQHWLLLQLV
jgi:phage gp45-like